MIAHARPILLSVFLALCVIARPALAADSLSLRGSSTPLPGSINSIDEAGVSFTPAGEFKPALYTWDRVRSVNSPIHASAAAPFMDSAQTLWRARARLQRGDVSLALPLFESLFPDYLSKNHETALIVAQGLARCHIALGEQHLAVIPALESIRLARHNVTTAAFDALPPFLDPTLSLPVNLPPVFLPSPALARLRSSLMEYDAQGDAFVASLARLYLAAAEQNMLGQSATSSIPPVTNSPQDAGLQLLTRLITLTSASSIDRQSARAETLRTIDSLPPFAQAWSRFQLGRSLLADADLQSQQQGMLNLAHLPARFRMSQPFLAAIALNELSSALETSGDSSAASALRTDLHQFFPHLAPSLVPLAAIPGSASHTQPSSAPTTQESL